MAGAGPETIYARQGVPLLAERLAALGTRRVLVLSSPSRRFVDQVVEGLQAFAPAVFDGAKVHVPARGGGRGGAGAGRIGSRYRGCGGGRIGHRSRQGAAAGPPDPLRRGADHLLRLGDDHHLGPHPRTARRPPAGIPRVRPDVVLYDAALTSSLPIAADRSEPDERPRPPGQRAVAPDRWPGQERAEAIAAAAALVRAMEDLLLAPADRAGARGGAAGIVGRGGGHRARQGGRAARGRAPPGRGAGPGTRGPAQRAVAPVRRPPARGQCRPGRGAGDGRSTARRWKRICTTC